MKHIIGRVFEGWNDAHASYSYSDIEFEKCRFAGCSLGFGCSKDFRRRSIVENVNILSSEARKCQIQAAVLRNINIENFRSDVIMVYGALFDHVTIKGRAGKWLVHGTFMGFDSTDQSMAHYQALSNQFYAGVDWAIDISQAEFEDFGFRSGGLPAALVRRDPETQVILRRDRIMAGKWRQMGLDLETQISLNFFLESGAQDNVLVVSKRDKHAKSLIQDIRRLQAEGIIEEN